MNQDAPASVRQTGVAFNDSLVVVVADIHYLGDRSDVLVVCCDFPRE